MANRRNPQNLTRAGRCALAIAAFAMVTPTVVPALGQSTYVPAVPTELRLEGMDMDIFDRSGLAASDAVASERGRLVVVFVGRSDSPPCRVMRKVAWCEPRVLAWAHEHARVFHVVQDLGDPNDAAAIRAWHVGRVPTTIVFRDGAEVDRVAGFRGGDRLLEFLQGAASGDTTRVRFERSLNGLRDGSWKPTPGQRLLLARDLLEASRLEEASEQFVFLWNHMVDEDPTMSRVRVGTLVFDLQSLCGAHGPSREIFAAKRDELESLLKEEETRTWPRLADWLALNRALKDDERCLAWFDRIKSSPNSSGTLERFAPQLELLLQSKGEPRAGEIILLYADPGMILRRDLEAMNEARRILDIRDPNEPPASPAGVRHAEESRAVLDAFLHRMGQYYCTLLRQGRERAADAFAADTKILMIDGSLTKAIVDEAIAQGIPHDQLADLLESAKRLGQDTAESERRLNRLKGQ